jgi:hypothetical protein
MKQLMQNEGGGGNDRTKPPTGAARALTYISVELYDPQFVQRIRTP